MITIGTKVAILPCDDYRNRFIGTQGIVQRYYHNKVGVKIDGCKNPESEFGVFWFREESLAVIPTNAIKDDAIRQIIFNGPKTIVIWSDGSKTISTMRCWSTSTRAGATISSTSGIPSVTGLKSCRIAS